LSPQLQQKFSRTNVGNCRVESWRKQRVFYQRPPWWGDRRSRIVDRVPPDEISSSFDQEPSRRRVYQGTFVASSEIKVAGGGGMAPHRDTTAELFDRITVPEDLAGPGIEAIEMANCSKRVDPAVVAAPSPAPGIAQGGDPLRAAASLRPHGHLKREPEASEFVHGACADADDRTLYCRGGAHGPRATSGVASSLRVPQTDMILISAGAPTRRSRSVRSSISRAKKLVAVIEDKQWRLFGGRVWRDNDLLATARTGAGSTQKPGGRPQAPAAARANEGYGIAHNVSPGTRKINGPGLRVGCWQAGSGTW
jgi:hypothetical protein